MLPKIEYGEGALTLVLLHLFGSAKSEWTECMASLASRFQCIAIDLPGFGDARGIPGYSVEEMANSVGETLNSRRLERFVLTGHSMSGKVGPGDRGTQNQRVFVDWSLLRLLLLHPNPLRIKTALKCSP